MRLSSPVVTSISILSNCRNTLYLDSIFTRGSWLTTSGFLGKFYFGKTGFGFRRNGFFGKLYFGKSGFGYGMVSEHFKLESVVE